MSATQRLAQQLAGLVVVAFVGLAPLWAGLVVGAL